MYEKPQYLTPDGYRRAPQNPLKRKQLQEKNQNFSARQKKRKTLGVKKLSPEAAKLIADAIRVMLHS